MNLSEIVDYELDERNQEQKLKDVIQALIAEKKMLRQELETSQEQNQKLELEYQQRLKRIQSEQEADKRKLETREKELSKRKDELLRKKKALN